MGYLKLFCSGGTRHLTAPCAEIEGEYPSKEAALSAIATLPAYSGIEAAEWRPGGYGCPDGDRENLPVRKKLTLHEYDLARSAGKATPYV